MRDTLSLAGQGHKVMLLLLRCLPAAMDSDLLFLHILALGLAPPAESIRDPLPPRVSGDGYVGDMCSHRASLSQLPGWTEFPPAVERKLQSSEQVFNFRI